eukprot:5509810-Pleurochrysis_carterae.AAC.2
MIGSSAAFGRVSNCGELRKLCSDGRSMVDEAWSAVAMLLFILLVCSGVRVDDWWVADGKCEFLRDDEGKDDSDGAVLLANMAHR